MVCKAGGYTSKDEMSMEKAFRNRKKIQSLKKIQRKNWQDLQN